jgi:type I restriction enzyme R subunit
MPHILRESEVENMVLAWFEGLGYQARHGVEIDPEGFFAARTDYSEVVLRQRLEDAIARLNPELPADAREAALRAVLRPEAPTLVAENRRLHRLLVDGVPVEYRRGSQTVGVNARLVDWDHPEDNDWLAADEFTVIEQPGPGRPASHRRADVVVFLNGLPIAVFELKSPTDENATLLGARHQLQTYQAEIPSLFRSNEILVISDGLEARVGSLTADLEWFLPWRTIEGQALAAPWEPQLRVLVQGLFHPARLLRYLHHCIVTEEDERGRLLKKIAGYHQFHAVQEAVRATVQASGAEGDRRGGVVWHTQGAGKSLTMAFFASQISQHPAMANPTLVVLTDRNDLDGQLFGTFNGCRDLLRETPVQAESRADLRQLLTRASGGVLFTTVQKFFPDFKGAEHPLLSDRRNIVVIADEAHRSQYDFIDGYARYMREALPNATFLGFTGTPLELDDRNTREVFGDYISIYDIERAVQDGATVPIYYEGRLAEIKLDESERPHLDEDFAEITEGEEEAAQAELKARWTQLEALVGAEERLALVAQDLVHHWEARLEAMDGKAMVVCMSRRICVAMYNALTQLRPEWHDPQDDKGVIKVIMTGSVTDPPEWQQHVRTTARRNALSERFKNPSDPFQIVIVRDMWLTGFDAPCLHTMYVDKPMRGHGLMQAIARVNRVFRDKPGGLVVDYIGLADQLSKAVRAYTEAGGQGETAIDKEQAVKALLEKHDICCAMMHGYDWGGWNTTQEKRLELLAGAADYILSLDDGKARWLRAVQELSQAFALAVPDKRALALHDDIAFFQQVRSVLAKPTASEQVTAEDRERAIQQLLSRAVAGEGVVDILAAAGLNKPDISVLDDRFLAQVQAMPRRNLAAELLERLLRGEVRARRLKNVVQARSFAEMLEQAIAAYHNRAITTAQLIERLIELAQDMRSAGQRGVELGLNDDELAFYDALADNESALEVMGDQVLTQMAHELVAMLRKNVTIDWTARESVKAKLRVLVRRLLRKYDYPPDKQERATETVLQQAEVLAGGWAEA